VRSRPFPRSLYALAVCPPGTSDWTVMPRPSSVRLTGAGFGSKPAGGFSRTMRGLIAGEGRYSQRKPSSPSLASTVASSIVRSLCTRARSLSVPLSVVILPRTSAFHRSRRRSTPVMAPTGRSSRLPTGSRATPQSLPPWAGRWSWDSLWWTVKRRAFSPGSW
jgi:hypothetical protein